MMKDARGHLPENLKKSVGSDLSIWYLLIAAGLIAFYIATYMLSEGVYDYCLVVPCMLFLGARLERDGLPKFSPRFFFSAVMIAWVLLLQLKRRYYDEGTANLGPYFVTYLFAFPLAAVLRGEEQKHVLKIFAGAFLLGATVLVVWGLLLFLDLVPDALNGIILWSGGRMPLLWNSNTGGRFLMIGIVMGMAFLPQLRVRWQKIILSLLLVLMVGILVMNGSRGTIISTSVYLGATFFFRMIRRGKKWFFPGMLAGIAVAVMFYEGSMALCQLNYERMCGPGSVLSETGPRAVVLAADASEINRKITEFWKTVEKYIGTLSHRTELWQATCITLANRPQLFIWGAADPGAEVSTFLADKMEHLHNSWFQCLVGLGAVGFLLALSFTVMTLWNSLGVLIKHHSDHWKRNMALLALCLMLNSLVEPYIFYTSAPFHPSDFLFFLCAGYLAHWQEADNRRILAAVRRKIPFLKKNG